MIIGLAKHVIKMIAMINVNSVNVLAKIKMVLLNASVLKVN